MSCLVKINEKLKNIYNCAYQPGLILPHFLKTYSPFSFYNNISDHIPVTESTELNNQTKAGISLLGFPERWSVHFSNRAEGIRK